MISCWAPPPRARAHPPGWLSVGERARWEVSTGRPRSRQAVSHPGHRGATCFIGSGDLCVTLVQGPC